MSVAHRTSVSPEFELVESSEQSVHYIEHGFPSPLVRWHYHDDYELHLIVDSVGKIFAGDYVGGFGPGQLVLTGPCLPHNWISRTEPDEVVELRDMVVQFRKELVPSMSQVAPELKQLLPLLERSRYGIEFTSVSCEIARQWFERIRDNNGPTKIAILLEFLETLSQESDYVLLSTMPMQASMTDASVEKIERVTKFVTENHAQEITLSIVAELVGMSESAFSRFFAKATGNGFSRFLNRVRVARACELLASSELPVTDICYQVGFNNVANFNRRFRELKGVTPRDYRKDAALRHSV